MGLIHKVHRAHSPKREEGRRPESSLHGGRKKEEQLEKQTQERAEHEHGADSQGA